MGLFDFLSKKSDVSFLEYIRDNCSDLDIELYLLKYARGITEYGDGDVPCPLFAYATLSYDAAVTASQFMHHSGKPPRIYKGQNVSYIDLLQILCDRGNAEAAFVIGALYEYGAYDEYGGESTEEIDALIDHEQARLYYSLAEERGSEMYRIYKQALAQFSESDPFVSMTELLIPYLILLRKEKLADVADIDESRFFDLNDLFVFILVRYAASGATYSLGMVAAFLIAADSAGDTLWENFRNIGDFAGIANKQELAEQALYPLYQLAEGGSDLAEHVIEKCITASEWTEML